MTLVHDFACFLHAILGNDGATKDAGGNDAVSATTATATTTAATATATATATTAAAAAKRSNAAGVIKLKQKKFQKSNRSAQKYI